MKRRPLVIGEKYMLSDESPHFRSLTNRSVRLVRRKGLFKQYALVRSYHREGGYSYLEFYVKSRHLL